MRTRKSILLAACGASAAALAACSPFAPELGNTPYLCADQEPRCPESYACLEDGNGRSICVAPGGTLPDARPDSGGGFQCAPDDVLEPNDTIAEAFQTDVGVGPPVRAFGPISTCPEGDRDHYQINVVTANRGIEVITRWDSGLPVSCAILNEAGGLIANGTAMGTNATRACAIGLTVRPYYAVAFSPMNLKSNYRIEMRIVESCALP